METAVKISRRAMLGRSAALLASIAILPILMPSKPAVAGSAAKEDFNYQDQPRNGKSCTSCSAFTPDGTGNGTCRIVAGTVKPTGWCMAYSERN